MFRFLFSLRAVASTFPHACGDVPLADHYENHQPPFSPRLWGCSASCSPSGSWVCLFPTPVGMFRPPRTWPSPCGTFPHACGDVPGCRKFELDPVRFSPRLWGCSVRPPRNRQTRQLFPTPVGMFRTTTSSSFPRAPFPHACGDVPLYNAGVAVADHFSPRLWGCSGRIRSACQLYILFPTPVGMFRSPPARSLPIPSFPHACGDVPSSLSLIVLTSVFSPRLWGCSEPNRGGDIRRVLFPTPVGMFR